jgi:FMN reductase
MNILVIGCSLNPDSNSQILAQVAADQLRSQNIEVDVVDLRKQRMIFCDGETVDESTGPLAQKIRAADAIVMAVPIYNYDVNAAAKNLVEHVSKAFEGKLIAFMCAAGGQGSYMSIMSLANSLMLDFRCLIVPRFVYSIWSDFKDEAIVNEKITERVKQLCGEVVRLAAALILAPSPSGRGPG